MILRGINTKILRTTDLLDHRFYVIISLEKVQIRIITAMEQAMIERKQYLDELVYKMRTGILYIGIEQFLLDDNAINL